MLGLAGHGDQCRTAELTGQRSETRSQKPEVRSQKSEVRSQKSEVRGQRSEVSSEGEEANLLGSSSPGEGLRDRISPPGPGGTDKLALSVSSRVGGCRNREDGANEPKPYCHHEGHEAHEAKECAARMQMQPHWWGGGRKRQYGNRLCEIWSVPARDSACVWGRDRYKRRNHCGTHPDGTGVGLGMWVRGTCLLMRENPWGRMLMSTRSAATNLNAPLDAFPHGRPNRPLHNGATTLERETRELPQFCSGEEPCRSRCVVQMRRVARF